MEIPDKICLFALNSYRGVNRCIKPCCGIVKLNAIDNMANVISSMGFDSNGKPCDYVDEDGTIWIYLGKRYGINDWGGIPKED